MRSILLAILVEAAAPAPPPHPETVVVTYRVRAGQQAAFETLLAESWSTMRRLDLVLPLPHVVVAAIDAAVFVEVFTWKDAAIPDDAPAPVRKLWNRMNALTAPNGIEVLEGRLVGR